MQNRIDAELTPERADAIVQTIRGFETEMPFLTDLSNEEIRSMIKMGDRGLPFVMDSLTLGEQDDSFLPRSFDVAKLRRDLNLFQQLMKIAVAAEHFLELVRDTMTVAGSDAFAGALELYSAAQKHGKGDALSGSLEQMSQRFKRKPKSKEEKPDTDEETPNP
ncbi:MAG TPA: hypothetical protein PKY59_10335 [Pyrinomonadaceae bacterium]|nr:hypothetical protein [Pyrinomonadaceae bacterium]